MCIHSKQLLLNLQTQLFSFIILASIIYSILITSCQKVVTMILQLIGFAFVFFLIILAVLHKRASKFKNSQTQLCIILGSGGHTTQMCQLFRNFDFQKCQKIFIVIGGSDQLSQAFFNNYFKEIYKAHPQKLPQFTIIKSKRTNEVKQSKITSIVTTLIATVNAFIIIVQNMLGVTNLVSNGPGICVPYFYLFFLLNKLKITKTKLIFVESWCRVATLSVAGRIVCYVADQYLVHWKDQVSMTKNARHVGQII